MNDDEPGAETVYELMQDVCVCDAVHGCVEREGEEKDICNYAGAGKRSVHASKDVVAKREV